MTKLASFTGRQLIRILLKFGFEIIRVKGSHHFLRHQDGRCTVVPTHRGENIGPGLLSQILRDCEITKKDLLNKL